MSMMRKPKKASSLRSPREVKRDGVEQSRGHWCHMGTSAACVTVSPTLILALTVLIKEEEEESVHDGDKDPTPEGDAAGWPGVGLDPWPSVE